MKRFARFVLWVAGFLVATAGVIHLLMTGHLLSWFAGALPGAPATASAAMALNHVVVGILLLPLGVGLATLGRPISRGERGALVLGVAHAAALVALPVVVVATATPDMMASGPFVVAATCLAAAALLVVASVAILARR